MVPDTLSHPPRRSITTLRTFLGTTILAVSCTFSAILLLFAAELFPFAKNPCETNKSDLDRTSFLEEYLMEMATYGSYKSDKSALLLTTI